MSSFRNAIRFIVCATALTLPLSAYAANYNVQVFFDTDANRGTGCTLTTANGPVSGIEQVLTTAVTVTGGTGTVTGVTRQVCTSGFFGSPIPVAGGWNVTVSPTGVLFVETHVGANVMTMTNIGTMRLAFNVLSGTLSDAMTSDFGDDILFPVRPGRRHAVTTSGPPRAIHLDGLEPDWNGVPVLGYGDAASPALRFLDAAASADLSDLYFDFHIQTNPAAPTAQDDSYPLSNPGSTLTVSTLGVMTNDSDPNHLPITAFLVEGPEHGQLTLNANGGFTYVHDGSNVLEDHFRYRVTNGTLESNLASVSIGLPAFHPYVFTSLDHATFIAGQFNTFQVTVTGNPTPALSEDGALPLGVTFHDNGDGTGTLSGAPAASTVGIYAIVFHAEKNKPHQADQNFTLTVTCPGITVTNPAVNTGTVGTPFSQTFTQSGGNPPIVWSKTGALPAGLTFNTVTGALSGTPTQGGTFPITVTATDSSGCSGTGSTYTLTILCNNITVTNPATSTGTVNVAFSQTFTQAGGIGATTFSLASGTLPAGLTLASTGVLSGTPTQKGTFPIVVRATDSNGCAANGPTYNLIINCQVITVTNPATNTGTVNVAFSQTFTAGNVIAPATFTINSGTLPAGLTLNASTGVLSGTPTQTGSFPITVKATDANGCTGTGAIYTLTIGCQVITVTNPATNTGTVNAAFSQSFTAGNAIAPVTFTLNSGVLPAGITLSSAGVLSGTPTQTGSFPITVKATDANGCTGTGATYTLTVGCQVIPVTNPATNSGTVNAPFSQSFTAGNTIGAVTFTLNSGTLPSGITLSSAGVLSGTPTQTGSFPITVKATDANGCTGTGATYTLTINCQVITVTNPATTTGTAGTAFSQTFTQAGSFGTFSFAILSGTLPAGMTFHTGTGVLDGTPTQTGSFPLVIQVTDSNGCTGTGAPYTLVIGCQTITVTNPVTTTGTAGTAFSQTFTQSGAIGGATFTTASTLPAGLTLSAGGVLSGTPTQTGSFPIVVTVTDGNGCTGTGAPYTLVIGCQTINVTNPVTNTGTAGSPFSQTFTQSGAIGGATFTVNSGTLPAGLTLSTGGVLSGTPTQTGSFPITVKVTDGNGCTGVGATYTLTIGCQTITVTNPATATGTIQVAFSQTFTQSGAIGGATFTLNSGSLPAGLTLSSAGVLSGTPTVTGSFPITVKVTDGNGCTGVSATYNLVINCQTITVINPGTTTGTVSTPFTQTFTQTGANGTATFTTASTLPAGLTLSTAGVLSGTPTQPGTFPIVVSVTDSNGCTGTGPIYTLIISCQTITVTNPATTSGAAGTPFSVTFTQTGGIGTITWSESGTLPTGLTFHTATGVLDGTPTQGGIFPITVTATDANGCTGTGPIYNLNIICPTITVTNPATTTGTVGVAFSQTFTQTGGVGTTTFSESGALPAGLTFHTATGVLDGTPTQGGSFPITVTATDANGCTGTGPIYTLVTTCPTITVTNPATNTGTVGVAFSQTFTQAGGIGTTTFSESGALPNGMTFHTATGVLDGTPTQFGTFPITVTATDSNGCQGTGPTYTLTISCPTITVTNPGVNTGTVDAPFSQTFTQSGAFGTATFSTASTLPAGLTLSAAGVLSGTPTAPGSFPIVVTVTDSAGCTGTGSTYTLTINCQTITVTNPATTTGTVDAPFSQTFTQSGVGTHTPATFTINSGSLPAGLTLSSAGVLSGTPTQAGSFPITVKVADVNGCFGISATYNLSIACQSITVTNPVVTSGTAGVAFSQTFTQSGVGTHTPATFTTASTLPTGFTLSTSGVLSGTTTQAGSFPIVVTVTDANGCTGTGSTYNLTIACNTISVTNPVNTNGTVASPFSEQFTQSGVLGTPSFTTASTLPTGLTLHSATGILDGTPTQSGLFNIVVTVTDSNGCTGTGSIYPLNIACNVITVTNPGVNTGTAGVAFSQTFTQTGGNGTIVWSETGTLPTGITLNSATGALFGTTTQVGSFPITVKATDANGCFGTSSYTLTINCQTITVTNPGVNSVQAGVAFDQTFTATGILGTVTWSESGALPTGITLNPTTGHLAGTTNVVGSFPITVTATDSNGCFGTGATYTLTVTCPTITVARTGGGSFPAGIFNTAYTGQSVTASGGSGSYTFAVTVGSLPTGLSLASGAISGTPTATGVFNFTITATDTLNSCTGSQAFSISIAPVAVGDSYPAASHLVDNTQFVITGGSTTSPATPFVGSLTNLIANDLPSGGVAATTGTFATSGGGSVTIAADGTFIYTPKANPAAAAVTSDSFTYTVVSNGVTSAAATVNLTLANRVWYVKNNGGGTNGQSQSPFTTLAAAQAASLAGDIIFVYNGDATTTGQNAGITLKANQQLIGEGVALVVNTVTLKTAGTKPQITNTAPTSDVVTLHDGNTVAGLVINNATRDGIAGNAHAGFTGDTLNIFVNAAAGLHLTSMTGAVTLTNAVITNNGTGLDINNGTATITLDATNSINAGASLRSVSIQNRPAAAGLITIGAAITDNGTGILVNNNASGTIAFTGAQTLATTTNPGITLTTNTGTTINFSGTLNVTTSTGTALNATGNGTLNVTGTANVTTGAAATGVNLSGVTVGASGVTLTSVNTTGATTGVSLTSLGNGNVTINSGTISGGTTGLSLNTLGTSTLTLGANAQTLTFTGSTTAISGTTFGTLAVAAGSTVNVSGATALNLTTGAVSGTFANVSSTGGTNGVNLAAVTGTWGVTAGTLTGATGSTFNATGTSTGTVTWAGAITQANAANVVTISGSHTGNITFSGHVTTSGTSTGINISASSGTYNFSDSTANASTIGGSGGGITIAGESGSVSFGAGYTINAATTSFKISGTTTANITYSGLLTNNGNGGILLDINNATAGTYTTGTINFNGTATPSLSVNNAGNTAVGSVAIKNMQGTLIINHMTLTETNNNYSGTLVSILGTNTGGSFTFNNMALSASGGSNTGKGLVLAAGSGGTLAITATGGNSSIDVGSTALSLDGTGNAVTLNASTLATLSSTGHNAASNVLLTSVTGGGTLTISGGTITGNAASAFKVSGGTLTISDAGTITQNTAGQRAVDISGMTAGTVTFSGAIGSGGIFLNSNTGATFSFTGLLTLNTGTSPGFTATAGGTVSATNTSNTIVSTTGTALNVANTTIAAGGLKFQSISANGGTNGIILDTTGATGSLTVSGTGSAGTGGTLQNMTGADASPVENATVGAGIYLKSTTSPSFNWMNLHDFSNYAVVGTNVTGFTMTNSVVNGTNGTNQGGAGEGDVYFTGLSGSATVTNCTFTGAIYDSFHVFNNASQNLNRITITGSTFATVGGAGNLANDALVFQGTGGTLNVTVQNSFMTGARGDLFNLDLHGTIASDLVFTGNALTNNNANIVSGGGGFTMQGGGAGNQETFTFNISNNTMRDAVGGALNIGAGTGAGTNHNYSGTISGNTIGVAGVTDSGSKQGSDIFINFNAAGTGTFNITNNQLFQYGNGNGINLNMGAFASSNPFIQLVVTGNTISNPGTFGAQGILLTAGTGPLPETGRICMTLGGAGGLANTLTGSGGAGAPGTEVRIRDRFDVKVGFPGYGGSTTDTNALATYLQGRNTVTNLAAISVAAPSAGTTNGTTNGFFQVCPP